MCVLHGCVTNILLALMKLCLSVVFSAYVVVYYCGVVMVLAVLFLVDCNKFNVVLVFSCIGFQ